MGHGEMDPVRAAFTDLYDAIVMWIKFSRTPLGMAVDLVLLSICIYLIMSMARQEMRKEA